MTVLIDTNILISAIWKQHSRIGNILKLIAQSREFTMVLTDQNIEEFKIAVNRKMPDRNRFVEPLLNSLAYNVIPTTPYETGNVIRDTTDQPILDAAIKNDVDIILTGDKDFLALDLEHPRCMTATEFFNEYYGE